MKLNVTQKMADYIAFSMKPEVLVMAAEGAARSIKTTVTIQAAHFNIQMSDEPLHLFAGNDLNSIRDVLLKSDTGLLTLYPELYKLERDEIGSYYVAVTSIVPGKPNKRILLCGFDNRKSWEKINGKQFGVIVLDEANTANIQFIDECFARQTNVDQPKLFITQNGDVPTKEIYTKYINYCNVLGTAPASILRDMNNHEKKAGWFYCHFTMKDNPAMTEEKLERAKSIYPVNSYYYTIKILGERGSSGELIFNDYLTFESHIKHHKPSEYNFFTIGCDIGSNGAKNSLTLVGWKRDFSSIAVLDNYTFKQTGYDTKKQIILNKVLDWANICGNIECIAIDSAEQNFIFDLRTLFKNYNLEVISSYKATIKQRIDLLVILMSLQRISFNDNEGGKRVYNSYLMAKWEKDKVGEVREDNNEEINDVMDATEYAITRHMKALLNVIDRTLKGV